MADTALIVEQGDTIERLRALPDASVDAVVTDPPYGLSEHTPEEVTACLVAWSRGEVYKPKGRGGFMGRAWDAWVPGPECWREVYRVLKPGGHLLSFAGSRTSDLMGIAIRLAGFEMRDAVQWWYGCLDVQTECLTRTGWKHYADLSVADEVMQWDPATGALSWVRPSEVLVYPYDGDLVTIENRHTRQVLTPNHRVLAKVRRHYRHADPTAFEVVEARAIAERPSGWAVDLPLAGQFQGSTDIDPDLAYLVGWWLTDAWPHLDGRACMFSQSKPETLKKLRTALAPYSPSEYVKKPRRPQHAAEHTFYVAGDLAEYLLREHPKRTLTWAMLDWRIEARRRLLDGLLDGDGSLPTADKAAAFWSQDTERRDIFVALCLSVGWRAYDDPKKGVVYLNRRTATTQVQGKHRSSPVRYRGDVWCVRVPTGAFVVRRDRRPFITGNSGFPKSLDVSKAIDKAAGATREVVRAGASGAGTKTVSALGDGLNVNFLPRPITAPATDEAKRWDGYGTALKPAHEPVIVARKPLDGTVAHNVLSHGTGALNIDACRVAYTSDADKASATPQGECTSKEIGAIGASPDAGRSLERIVFERPEQKGRWPANVVLTHTEDCVVVGRGVARGHAGYPNGPGGKSHHYSSDKRSAEVRPEPWAGVPDAEVDVYACVPGCPVRALDDQSGERPGCRSPSGAKPTSKFRPNQGNTMPQGPIYPDTGGASRFFYTSKASRRDRNTCVDGEVRPGVANVHPTVKPIQLMRWLVRLVCPPGGLVLDPFAGSGTTGVAAHAEGAHFIGIDGDAEHCEIMRRRYLQAPLVEQPTEETTNDQHEDDRVGGADAPGGSPGDHGSQ